MSIDVQQIPPVTRILAEYVATHPSRGWGDDVEREAHRAFLNWMGCAVGAAGHPAVDAAMASVRILAPAVQATVLGRRERVDIASAALVNGISSHALDYDDTHETSLIHPSGPVVSAVLSLAEHFGMSGRAVVDAIVLGIDVACRVGLGLYPEHFDRGWHITGTAGPIGAAAACARLLELDPHGVAMALGIAASQPVGLREQFGSMTKPLHPGAAAQAGLMSALLASKGYTASPQALEAKRGYFQTISDRQYWDKVIGGLGERFELMANTYKPFACGMVMHAAIDGCIQLREHGIPASAIDRIELRVDPLVFELTGKPSPRTGLEGKFSVFHGCAVGYLFGKAGSAEFSDGIVNDPNVAALRSRIRPVPSDQMSETSADVALIAVDGRRVHAYVEHAVGSLRKPMSDAQLELKFENQAAPVIGTEKCARLLRHCRDLGSLASVAGLCETAIPQEDR